MKYLIIPMLFLAACSHSDDATAPSEPFLHAAASTPGDVLRCDVYRDGEWVGPLTDLSEGQYEVQVPEDRMIPVEYDGIPLTLIREDQNDTASTPVFRCRDQVLTYELMLDWMQPALKPFLL